MRCRPRNTIIDVNEAVGNQAPVSDDQVIDRLEDTRISL